jgi:hypothetical protein
VWVSVRSRERVRVHGCVRVCTCATRRHDTPYAIRHTPYAIRHTIIPRGFPTVRAPYEPHTIHTAYAIRCPSYGAWCNPCARAPPLVAHTHLPCARSPPCRCTCAAPCPSSCRGRRGGCAQHSGCVKEPAYTTFIRAPYVKIRSLEAGWLSGTTVHAAARSSREAEGVRTHARVRTGACASSLLVKEAQGVRRHAVCTRYLKHRTRSPRIPSTAAAAWSMSCVLVSSRLKRTTWERWKEGHVRGRGRRGTVEPSGFAQVWTHLGSVHLGSR